jgi:hypothetical protein
MLTPSAKAALAEHLATIQVPPGSLLTALELKRLAIGNVGGLIGMQDDPHRNRIRRQISKWVDGPPQGWRPPQPQVQGVDEQGQPQLGPPPPDPILAGIFAPLPVDDEPSVAQVRHDELARCVSGTKFQKWAPEWQQGILAEYDRARKAAGVLTLQEQQAPKDPEKPPSVSVSAKAELTNDQLLAMLKQAGLDIPPAPAPGMPGAPGEPPAAVPAEPAPGEPAAGEAQAAQLAVEQARAAADEGRKAELHRADLAQRHADVLQTQAKTQAILSPPTPPGGVNGGKGPTTPPGVPALVGKAAGAKGAPSTARPAGKPPAEENAEWETELVRDATGKAIKSVTRKVVKKKPKKAKDGGAGSPPATTTNL